MSNDKRTRTGARRPSKRTGSSDVLRLYGLHTVRAALRNRDRRKHRLLATENAFARLEVEPDCPFDIVKPDALDRLVGRDAVHQGVVLECKPLDRIDGSELFRLGEARLVLALDQVTDPHNVGAILRSAVALGVDCVVTTHRDSAPETGVLAKSASGALDMVEIAEVRNLSKTLSELRELGLACIGLDSEGAADVRNVLDGKGNGRVVLVLGAEGRGLREKTREACSHLARLDLPGPIKSLNVSNAAALALYLARAHVDDYSSKPR